MKNTRGETLLEVLVSLTALMITGAAASALLVSSMRTTSLSGNYLIAQNLAVEAVEGIKNVLITNQMLHPDDIDANWDLSDPTDTAEIGNGTYIAKYNETNKVWTLVSSSDGTMVLDQVSPDRCEYVHAPTGSTNNPNCGVSKNFSRLITVSAVEQDLKSITAEINVTWNENSSDYTFSTGAIVINAE